VFHYFTIKSHFSFFRFKFFASLRFSNFCFESKQSEVKFKSIFSFFFRFFHFFLLFLLFFTVFTFLNLIFVSLRFFRLFYLRFRFRFLVFRIEVNHVKCFHVKRGWSHKEILFGLADRSLFFTDYMLMSGTGDVKK
jgi:hypothetical protein